MLAARALGTFQGKRVFRFPVRVQLNSSRQLCTVAELVYLVHSFSAAAAADYVRDLWSTRAETEITCYGPKGGKAAYRFIGWESAISHAMIANHSRSHQPHQLPFTFEV